MFSVSKFGNDFQLITRPVFFNLHYLDSLLLAPGSFIRVSCFMETMRSLKHIANTTVDQKLAPSLMGRVREGFYNSITHTDLAGIFTLFRSITFPDVISVAFVLPPSISAKRLISNSFSTSLLFVITITVFSLL